MSKYGSRRTVVDGIRFDSQAEARRYGELRLLEAAGSIFDLKLQVEYQVHIKGQHICSYLADFVYFDREKGEWVIEDVKGVRTQVYRLKKRLVEAIYGITITEVPA
ncbi:MAG: DUF1064 domain-containing protein [Sideroxydans sp.]|nr:DUF1064 domain-containing protein [Sideroxydans sp.]